jgi:hypothetical protein
MRENEWAAARAAEQLSSAVRRIGARNWRIDRLAKMAIM